MNECANQAIEQDFINSLKCEDVFGSSQPFKKSKELQIIWVAKDERKLNIRDMTTSHIQFSIAKCKRDNWRVEAIPYLEAELSRRGV